MIYQQRAQPLEAFVSGAAAAARSAALAALAFLALASRHRLLATLDRRYFREEDDTRQLLDRLMVDMLHSTNTARI